MLCIHTHAHTHIRMVCVFLCVCACSCVCVLVCVHVCVCVLTSPYDTLISELRKAVSHVKAFPSTLHSLFRIGMGDKQKIHVTVYHESNYMDNRYFHDIIKQYYSLQPLKLWRWDGSILLMCVFLSNESYSNHGIYSNIVWGYYNTVNFSLISIIVTL